MPRNSIPREVIASVIAAGFDVYMRDPSDSWLIYAEGKSLGYLQISSFGGYDISTVHMPNRQVGTGFRVIEGTILINRETLLQGFIHAPAWASHGDWNSVQKWNGIEAYKARDSFAAKYERVTL